MTNDYSMSKRKKAQYIELKVKSIAQYIWSLVLSLFQDVALVSSSGCCSLAALTHISDEVKLKLFSCLGFLDVLNVWLDFVVFTTDEGGSAPSMCMIRWKQKHAVSLWRVYLDSSCLRAHICLCMFNTLGLRISIMFLVRRRIWTASLTLLFKCKVLV